jgi:hypothetical protein
VVKTRFKSRSPTVNSVKKKCVLSPFFLVKRDTEKPTNMTALYVKFNRFSQPMKHVKSVVGPIRPLIEPLRQYLSTEADVDISDTESRSDPEMEVTNEFESDLEIEFTQKERLQVMDLWDPLAATDIVTEPTISTSLVTEALVSTPVVPSDSTSLSPEESVRDSSVPRFNEGELFLFEEAVTTHGEIIKDQEPESEPSVACAAEEPQGDLTLSTEAPAESRPGVSAESRPGISAESRPGVDAMSVQAHDSPAAIMVEEAKVAVVSLAQVEALCQETSQALVALDTRWSQVQAQSSSEVPKNRAALERITQEVKVLNQAFQDLRQHVSVTDQHQQRRQRDSSALVTELTQDVDLMKQALEYQRQKEMPDEYTKRYVAQLVGEHRQYWNEQLVMEFKRYKSENQNEADDPKTVQTYPLKLYALVVIGCAAFSFFMLWWGQSIPCEVTETFYPS